MRILICGGRSFANQEKFDLVVHPYEHRVSKIIHGCSTNAGGLCGADRMADEWAKKVGIVPWRFHAKWRVHGNAAGPIRNQRMLDEAKPVVVIAFPGGSGTADMVEKTRAAIRGGARIELIEVV